VKVQAVLSGITNDDMVIGNPTYDTSGNNNRGCVYFYEYAGGTWNYDSIFVGANDGDNYGSYVVLDDSQIGQKDLAISTNVSTTEVGTVQVYRDIGFGWVFAGTLFGENTGDFFGEVVRIHNGKMVIGAKGYDGVSINSGALYTYQWSSGWTFANKLTSSIEFGSGYGDSGSVDIYGDWLVAGDRAYDSDNGIVYIYKWDGASFSDFQTLPSLGSNFGSVVSVDEQTIIVDGRWVYEFNGSSWVYSNDLGVFLNPNISSLHKDAFVVASSFAARFSVKGANSWDNLQTFQPPFFAFVSTDLNDRQIVFTNGANVQIYECGNELLSLDSSSSSSKDSSSSSSSPGV
jgi:hypothetical protein